MLLASDAVILSLLPPGTNDHAVATATEFVQTVVTLLIARPLTPFTVRRLRAAVVKRHASHRRGDAVDCARL